jgi:hypothetical protein
MTIVFAISCSCGEVMVPGTAETEKGGLSKLFLPPGWSAIQADPDFDGGESVEFNCSGCSQHKGPVRSLNPAPKATLWSVIMSIFGPSKGSFAWAWKRLLKGKTVRRKAWVDGVYIYTTCINRRYPDKSFVSLGGIPNLSPKNLKWKPYIADFSKNDWEEVIVLFE